MRKGIRFQIVVWSIAASVSMGFGAKKGSKNKKDPKAIPAAKILILDPVNLKNNSNDKELGIRLRDIFSHIKKWDVIDQDKANLRLVAFEKNINKPCKGIACAHEFGDINHAEYALFTSISKIQNMFVFNLNLLHVRQTRVVGTAVGEIVMSSYSNKSRLLHYKLKSAINKLAPIQDKSFHLEKKGFLGILDASDKSSESKAMMERLFTYAYSSQIYDVMEQNEIQYSYDALKMNGNVIKADRNSITPIGKKLGLDYILHSKLYKTGPIYFLELSLFDIKRKSLIRKLPFQSKNFFKILSEEEKFFKRLIEDEKASRTHSFNKSLSRK